MLIYRLQSACSYFCAHSFGWGSGGSKSSASSAPSFILPIFFHFSLFPVAIWSSPISRTVGSILRLFVRYFFFLLIFLLTFGPSVGPAHEGIFSFDSLNLWNLSGEFFQSPGLSVSCHRPPSTDRLRSGNFASGNSSNVTWPLQMVAEPLHSLIQIIWWHDTSVKMALHVTNTKIHPRCSIIPKCRHHLVPFFP